MKANTKPRTHSPVSPCGKPMTKKQAFRHGHKRNRRTRKTTT